VGCVAVVAFWATVKTCVPIAMAPTRDVVPVFAATVKFTVPDPVPEPVGVIHVWLLVAAHAQPAAAVTVNEPDAPAPAIVVFVGDSTYEHVLAAWVTVNVFPAIVNAPVRCTLTVLGATLNVTVPLPLPFAPAVMVIQLRVLDAVQAQPAPAVTLADPVPPAAGTDCELGEIAKVQVEAACVTVNVLPPTVAIAVRCRVVVLAAAENVTVALPVPLAGLVSVSHAVLVDAVHAQPVDVVNDVDAAPPFPATFCDVGESV
jgi:hypothetical protein